MFQLLEQQNLSLRATNSDIKNFLIRALYIYFFAIWGLQLNVKLSHVKFNQVKSCYTFVTCNRYKVKKKLIERSPASPCQQMEKMENVNGVHQRISDVSIASRTVGESGESTLNESENVFNNEGVVFYYYDGENRFHFHDNL